MPTYSFEIFADYHQFALQDEHSSGDLSDAWTVTAIDRLLAVAPGVVGIGTISDVTLSVEVELDRPPPSEDWDAWDHVVEASLELPSGQLVVLGGTDFFPEAPRIRVAPGTYRVRSHIAAPPNERYRVALWPAPEQEPQVLKQAPMKVLFPGTA